LSNAADERVGVVGAFTFTFTDILLKITKICNVLLRRNKYFPLTEIQKNNKEISNIEISVLHFICRKENA
jgi:hypothetical protein